MKQMQTKGVPHTSTSSPIQPPPLQQTSTAESQGKLHEHKGTIQSRHHTPEGTAVHGEVDCDILGLVDSVATPDGIVSADLIRAPAGERMNVNKAGDESFVAMVRLL